MCPCSHSFPEPSLRIWSELWYLYLPNTFPLLKCWATLLDFSPETLEHYVQNLPPKKKTKHTCAAIQNCCLMLLAASWNLGPQKHSDISVACIFWPTQKLVKLSNLQSACGFFNSVGGRRSSKFCTAKHAWTVREGKWWVSSEKDHQRW